MPLPATGADYADILQPGINPIAIRKGIVTDVLIRDYHGSSTDLSDPSVGLNANGHFSPFAEDGKLRDDLLITAAGPNLGFYHLGGLSEDGVTYTPEVDIEETMIAQSRRNVRVDITKENDSIKFVARESTPLIDWLRDDKPLIGLLDLGEVGYSTARPAEGNVVERQIIALMFDGTHRGAKVMPRCMRSDVGETAWNKTDPDDLSVTYQALLCPYAGYPVLTLREGEGWRGLGGYPVFPAIAPIAIAVTATTATVSHGEPTGEGNPWTYDVEQSVAPHTTWTPSTVGSSAVVGGVVTHDISGLTTATAYKFRVIATGTNALSVTSAPSNAVTTP